MNFPSLVVPIPFSVFLRCSKFYLLKVRSFTCSIQVLMLFFLVSLWETNIADWEITILNWKTNWKNMMNLYTFLIFLILSVFLSLSLHPPLRDFSSPPQLASSILKMMRHHGDLRDILSPDKRQRPVKLVLCPIVSPLYPLVSPFIPILFG